MTAVDTPYAAPLDWSRATVLVTGGATGIGLGLVKELLAVGSTVIVTSRKQEALEQAKSQHPSIHILQADVSSATSRIDLARRVLRDFPAVNVLVNNAGVLFANTLHGASPFSPASTSTDSEVADWSRRQSELDTNIAGPVHLTSLFLPHFLSLKGGAAVVNLTSEYGFAPSLISPNYSGSKAFLHSYTVSTRQALGQTAVQVYEIAPPLVKTAMSGYVGEELDAFSQHVIGRIRKGEKEVGFNSSERARLADRKDNQRIFEEFTQTAASFGLYKPYTA
jgi:uncharacterized oxidoreductase